MDPALRKSLIMSVISSIATLGIATYYLTQYAPQLPQPPPLVEVNCQCRNKHSVEVTQQGKPTEKVANVGNVEKDNKDKVGGPDAGKKYRTCQQFWNEQTTSWTTRASLPAKKVEEMNQGCLFVANHRSLCPKHQVQGESYWHIEILDQQLVKDLRTQLTEVEAIYEDKPQLDAQDIFLHLQELKYIIEQRQQYIQRRKNLSSTFPNPINVNGDISTTLSKTTETTKMNVMPNGDCSASASTSSSVSNSDISLSSDTNKISIINGANGVNKIYPRSNFVCHSLTDPSTQNNAKNTNKEVTDEDEDEEKDNQDLKAEREREREKEREKELENMDVQALKDTITGLKELVGFVEEAFESTATKLERLLPENQISWNLLWCLFKPQSLVVTYHEVSGEPIAFQLKACSYIDNGQHKFVSLQGQKVEWNGKKFTKTWQEVRLLKWKGLRKISSLLAFPITDQLRKELTERGRLYAKLAGTPKYLHYMGPLIRVEGHGLERRILKLRAEGRIVVDVKSYRRMNPTRDYFTRSWYAKSRNRLRKSSPTRIGGGGNVPNLSDEEDVGENSLLGSTIREEDLCLTPPTIYAFSMVLKDWGEIKVEDVKEIVFDEDAYEHLVLDEDHKDMIKCLVDATAGENKTNKIVTDVISGKGGGAIVVLHGNPGTGKTLTAEAVAEHLKRPLYSVGAGELGVHAEVLERRLRDTLEVAKTWGAVLLIDEADVFLEERSLRDVSRNAMVSVFLRLLEYHSGVLFLTTNRIKSFDEAFLSRFSVALKYPNLDKEKRKMIWIKFLNLSGFKIDITIQAPTKTKLSGIKAIPPPNILTPPISPPHSPKPSSPSVQVVTAGDLEKFASKIFNGRSIKNIIRTAQALAISAQEQTSVKHIEKVMRIAEQFTRDFQETDEIGIYEVDGEGWKDKTRMHY